MCVGQRLVSPPPWGVSSYLSTPTLTFTPLTVALMWPTGSAKLYSLSGMQAVTQINEPGWYLHISPATLPRPPAIAFSRPARCSMTCSSEAKRTRSGRIISTSCCEYDDSDVSSASPDDGGSWVVTERVQTMLPTGRTWSVEKRIRTTDRERLRCTPTAATAKGKAHQKAAIAIEMVKEPVCPSSGPGRTGRAVHCERSSVTV
mmetsp:Transcript_28193/g.81683  ORF Transcript_28193/g.81683 Transcript_28193/m.81683 type:complete len:203 (-) Transcript_28193:3252-3860(-)